MRRNVAQNYPVSSILEGQVRSNIHDSWGVCMCGRHVPNSLHCRHYDKTWMKGEGETGEEKEHLPQDPVLLK